MHFFRSTKVRTTLTPSKDPTAAKRKREEQGMPPPGPRITFKQSKFTSSAPTPSPKPTSQQMPRLHIPNHSSPAPAAQPKTTTAPSTPSTPSGGGFKLKLKFGQKPK